MPHYWWHCCGQVLWSFFSVCAFYIPTKTLGFWRDQKQEFSDPVFFNHAYTVVLKYFCGSIIKLHEVCLWSRYLDLVGCWIPASPGRFTNCMTSAHAAWSLTLGPVGEELENSYANARPTQSLQVLWSSGQVDHLNGRERFLIIRGWKHEHAEAKSFDLETSPSKTSVQNISASWTLFLVAGIVHPLTHSQCMSTWFLSTKIIIYCRNTYTCFKI